MLDGGAVFVTPQRRRNYQDGRQVVVGPYDFVGASRMFIEDTIRSRVEALPNVSVRRAQVTGLAFAGDEARGVRVRAEGGAQVFAADFVVDATGRGGRLADWLAEGSYDRPTLERLAAPINYATAVFERAQEERDLPLAIVSARNNPPYSAGQLAVGVVKAIEGDRWLMTLMGYDDMRPARTIEEFRAACAPLPPLFAAVAAGTALGDVQVYRQAESGRRDFTGLGRLPGRLVSVGDAVASFNPVYGQGMTSAALHASCLSQYLRTGPDLRSAAGFFDMQRVVVDAAWSISVGGDAARLDAQAGVVPPDEVRLQREAMSQLLRALTSDTEVAKVVEPVIGNARPSRFALRSRPHSTRHRGQQAGVVSRLTRHQQAPLPSSFPSASRGSHGSRPRQARIRRRPTAGSSAQVLRAAFVTGRVSVWPAAVNASPGRARRAASRSTTRGPTGSTTDATKGQQATRGGIPQTRCG